MTISKTFGSNELNEKLSRGLPFRKIRVQNMKMPKYDPLNYKFKNV